MDRRKFLQASLLTLGAAAPGLSYWLGGVRDGIAPIFPRAKSVVVLFMSGGPSQIELFDYKEALERMDGKTISGFENESETTAGPIVKPIQRFRRRGQSGAWVSDLLPKTAEIADELTFIKSVNCRSNAHSIAQLEFNTGGPVAGDPFSGA